MCGIAGAPSFDKAFELYEKNLERGCFASGFVGLLKDGNEIVCTRRPGRYDKDKLKQTIGTDDITYCLFHSRAPTNTGEQTWSPETTHPFAVAEYFVAQNGIITNFKDFPEAEGLLVDTSIIPIHLNTNNGDIPKTYSAYQGLLTSWILNVLTKRIYIVKAGSSLHVDQDSFSSLEFEGSTPVDTDGVIYTYQDKNLTVIDTFTYNNPYFV